MRSLYFTQISIQGPKINVVQVIGVWKPTAAFAATHKID